MKSFLAFLMRILGNLKFTVIIGLLMFCGLRSYAQGNRTFLQLIKPSFHSTPPNDTIGISELLKLSDKNTIVGFGEATHGTREFRQAFVKLVKGLVQRHGFNVVLLAECGFSDTYYLNQYVVYGYKCPQTYNKNQSVIDEDFKALVEWLRLFNSKRPEADRVWVLGSDILFVNTIALDALMISRDLEIPLSASENELLCELAFVGDEYNSPYFRLNKIDHIVPLTHAIVEKIKAVAKTKPLTSHQKYIFQSVSNLTSSVVFLSVRSGSAIPKFNNVYNLRDSCIFANIQWIKSNRPNPKIVLFAHNNHLEKDYGDISLKMTTRLGHLLASKYPENYFAIGSEAGKGEFFYNGRISERKDRIGQMLSATQLGEGVLLTKTNPELKEFLKGKFTMTKGSSGPVGGSFSLYKNIGAAYDAIYYTPISSNSTPLVSRYPFEDFTLSKLVRLPMNNKTLLIEVNGLFQYDSNYCYGQSAILTILCINRSNDLTEVYSYRLTSGNPLSRELKFPEKTESLRFLISGRGVSNFKLTKLVCDNFDILKGSMELQSRTFEMHSSLEGIEIEKKR